MRRRLPRCWRRPLGSAINRSCQAAQHGFNSTSPMTLGQKPGPQYRFVPVVLPWVVAVGALGIYLLTLNPWVSLMNLPQVVKTAGWTWQPNLLNPLYSDLLRPAYYVATYPIRWLPAKW